LSPATKLVGTGIEVKLVGQKGIGLFASKAMHTQEKTGIDLPASKANLFQAPPGVRVCPVGVQLAPPLCEESAVVMINKRGCDVSPQDLRQAFGQLTAAQQRAFKHLPTMWPVDRTSLYAIFRATVFTPLPILSSGYTIHSMMNPSCRPNVRLLLSFMKNCEFVIFLTKDVKPGGELTYTDTHSISCMTTAGRQEYFGDLYSVNPYQCRCELCSAPAAVREVSDRRRRMMRQLLYLITGDDLPDVRPAIKGLKADKPGSELRAMHEYMFDQLAEAEGVTWMTPQLK
jgi:hypothetical protein